ncbi:MAG: tRNA lysidine(34) synthetase TilS [Deltaproteobacteria bacterium RBG_16_49_23]|nr:MAG: tRNA lysidine(34) synthetase TilS [Deltaproteobacteria bacterium RBG_16_49_23]
MLVEQVRRAIDRYRLLERGDRVIVGVSAGVDSMVLLHLLNGFRQEFELSLIIAHIHHGLRPVESEREAELVQQVSVRLGLPFEYGTFNVKEFKEAGGFSLQDAARKVRFQFFHRLLKKYGGGKIALGHHADDQVETVLLRLFRGSGLKGLKGMLPIRENRVIRPLLDVWKEEIEAFARENAIPYLIDSSNLKKEYLRNRLRLNLIPLIEQEFQPGFRRAVVRTSILLREENNFIEKEAGEVYQKITREEENGVAFKFSSYSSLHQAIQWRFIQKMLEKMDGGSTMDDGEWSDANLIYRRLDRPSASFFLELSHGLCLEKRYDMILLRKERPKTIPPFEVELPIPGRTYIQEIGREVVTEERGWDKSGRLDDSPNVALIDYQSLRFPLRIRNFRPGDRFQPMGTGGTQKLKEFFIDHKIPKFEREYIPLLISGEIIAWVAGYRIDERVKITPNTRRVLRVEIL